MSAFILNPRPICDADSVLREVEDWLEGPALRGPTCDVERFEAKWSALTRDERVMLAGLVAEGGIRVKETTIQRFLGDHSGVDARSVPLAFLVARSGLLTQGLVEFRPDIYSGNEMSLHPTWEWHVRQAVAEHREEDLPPSP